MATSVQCKLCSATNNLISLFSGKCVENRNYIRKLVADSTGIQSINSKSRRTHKYEIQNIGDIKLPSLIELKNTLAEWLRQKLEEQDLLDDKKLLEVSTQTCPEKDSYRKTTTTATTQTSIDTISIDTQYDMINNKEISTQTECLSKQHSVIQCDLTSKLKKESYTQTECKIVNTIATQAQVDIDRRCNCTKTLVSSETQRNGTVIDINRQEVSGKTDGESQVTNNLSSNQLSYVQNIYINQKTVDNDNTNNIATTSSMKKKKEIPKLAMRSLHHPASKTSTQFFGGRDVISKKTDMQSSKIVAEHFFAIQHPPLHISTIKEEVNSPDPSPRSLTDNDENKEGALTSSQNNTYVSPTSCNLLAIKERIQRVNICRYCDHTLYSKAEVKHHRKTHLICCFCKKTFSSVRKTSLHMDFECNRKVARLPFIPMLRIEDVKEVQETSPQLCLQLKHMASISNPAKRKSLPNNFCSKKAKLE